VPALLKVGDQWVFLPDGEFLVTGSEGTLRVLKSDGSDEVASVPYSGEVREFGVIVSNRKVKYVDLESGEALAEPPIESVVVEPLDPEREAVAGSVIESGVVATSAMEVRGAQGLSRISGYLEEVERLAQAVVEAVKVDLEALAAKGAVERAAVVEARAFTRLFNLLAEVSSVEELAVKKFDDFADFIKTLYSETLTLADGEWKPVGALDDGKAREAAAALLDSVAVRARLERAIGVVQSAVESGDMRSVVVAYREVVRAATVAAPAALSGDPREYTTKLDTVYEGLREGEPVERVLSRAGVDGRSEARMYRVLAGVLLEAMPRGGEGVESGERRRREAVSR